MSASRKKQERKAAEETIITSRAQEAAEKEAKRKRNTLIYSIIGVVVVILVAILLIWNSGIIQRNTKVAEINGEKVTASQVAYYYYSNDVMYTANLYSSYGYIGSYNPSVSPKEQTVTAEAVAEYGISEDYLGKSFHDYFLDSALNSLSEEQHLLAAAKEAGYTMSETGKDSIKSEMESLDETLDSYLSTYGADLTRTSYLQMLYGQNMNESKYRQCLENRILADEFYDAYFTTLADYSDEELDAYYQENKDTLDTITYYWRQFDGSVEKTTDADGKTVEPTEEEKTAAMEAAHASAEAALAEVEGNLDAVVGNEDYTEATGLLVNTSSFYYDWLVDAERKSGDATILDDSTGYYVVVFGERYRSETPTVDVRHILVEAEVAEGADAPTDEAYAAAEKKAQELLDQWKAGEATEESFAALVADNSADTASAAVGGLYENVYENYMIDAFNDWIFDESRQSGDTGLVKNTESSTKGWHIIYFIGHDEPVWKTSARSGIWGASVKDSADIVRTDKLDTFFG